MGSNQVDIRIVVDDLASPAVQAIRSKIAEASAATSGGLAAIEASSKQTKATLADLGTSIGPVSVGLEGAGASAAAAGAELGSIAPAAALTDQAIDGLTERLTLAAMQVVSGAKTEAQALADVGLKLEETAVAGAHASGGMEALAIANEGARASAELSAHAVELLTDAIHAQAAGAADAGIRMREATAAIAAELQETGRAAEFVAAQVEGDYVAMIDAALAYQEAVTASSPAILRTLEAFRPVAAEVASAYASMGAAARAYGTAATESASGAAAGLARLGEVIIATAEAEGWLAVDAAAASTALQGQATAAARAATGTSSMAGAFGSLSGAAGAAWTAGKKVVDVIEDVAKYAALATGAINFLTVHYAQQAVELANLGSVYGMTGTEIASLASLAAQAGVPVDSLREGMVQFQRSLAGVGDGAKRTQAVLGALGISLENADGSAKSANDVLLDLADVFERLPDGEAKTAAAAALGGESFAKLVPILSQGRDAFLEQQQAAERYGTALTGLQVLVAQEVVGSFNDAKLSVQGLGFAIQTEAGPAVATMLQGFADWVAANRTLLAQDVKGFINAIRVGLQEAAPYAFLMGHGIQYLGELIGLFPASLGTLNDQLKSTQVQLAANDRAARESGDAYGELAAKNDELRQKEGDLTAKILAQTPATRAQQEQMKGLKDVTDSEFEAAKRAAGGTDQFSEMLRKLQGALKGSTSGAGQAARQLDDFNAAAAKATASELAKHVETLGSALAELPLPQALERLPGLLNLNQQALDAEVQSIQAETEKKLNAAKTDEARSAALAEETDRIQKATIASEENAQKLVDTVTHTESAVKITEDYAKSLQSLQQAQDGLQITVIDDQIQAITEHWRDLDTATRESQLPAVLELIAKKYEALGQKADDANQKLIDNARATYDAAEAAYALTGSEQDLASMVAALNALWGTTEEVQKKAALETQHLAAQLGSESQRAKDAAAGLSDYGDAAQLAAGMSSDLAKAMENLLLTGQFRDLGRQLFSQLLDQSLVPFAQAGLDSIIRPAINGALSGLGIASFQAAGASVGGSIAGAIGTGFSSIGSGILTAAVGETGAAVIGAGLGSAAVGAAVVAGVAGIGLGIAAAFGAFEGPTMVQQIARHFSKMIRGALEDPQIQTAINAGLGPMGLQLEGGLEEILIKSPKKMGADVGEAYAALGKDLSGDLSEGFFRDMEEHGAQLIHSSIADITTVFFNGLDKAAQVGLNQAVDAAGAAMARFQGLVGDKAIAAANQFGLAILGLGHKLGWTAQQTEDFANKVAGTLGSSGAVVASLDQLNADAMQALGPSGFKGQMDLLNETLTTMTGKKVHAGNLDDALKASGLSIEQFMTLIQGMGFGIDALSADFTQLAVAAAGDAGTVIGDASADMAAFGNTADGTAEILEQKVVAALGNVMQSAAQLSYSETSIQALGAAAAGISPELLKSSSVVDELRQDFAQMAVASHQSVAQLVASINPPLPAAVQDAIFAVEDLQQAFGVLSGASNANLAAVVEDFQRFAGQIRDSEGELTSMGKVLVDQTRSAIEGMKSAILEDSQVTLDEASQVLQQLALIPAEALSDPSVKAAYDEMIANLLSGTDSTTVDELNAKIQEQAVADEAKAKAAHDAAAAATAQAGATDDLTQSLTDLGTQVDGMTGGPTVADALGVTPEVAAQVQGATTAITDAMGATQAATAAAAKDVQAIAGAFADSQAAVQLLAQVTGLSSQQILAAIQPIVGVKGDGQSLSAQEQLLGDITSFLPNQATPAFQQFGTDASGAVSAVYTSAVNAKSAMDDLAGDYDVNVHYHYTSDGSSGGSDSDGDGVPDGADKDPNDPSVFHQGGIIPGPPGTERIIKGLAGELVVPPDVTSGLLSAAGAGRPVSFGIPSGPGVSGPSAAEIGRAVAAALTQGGRYILVAVPSHISPREIARLAIVDELPRRVADKTISIPGFRRNSGAPG